MALYSGAKMISIHFETPPKFQPDSCEMRPTDTSRSHILKYDGQQYHFDREKFFSLNDPNQEE